MNSLNLQLASRYSKLPLILNKLGAKRGIFLGAAPLQYALIILLLSATSVIAAEQPPVAPTDNIACSSTGATHAITLSSSISRDSGVTPLSVFFDASGTTAASTMQPFHELEYRWDFGDPAGSPVSGTTWKTGSRALASSRNEATGPVSTHIYERPGTYYASLEVTDGSNTVTNSCTKIVVQDPDEVFAGTNTTCVGATALPLQGVGGCPAGAATAQQPDFVAAILSYAKTGKRVLFKSGDTFTAATTAGLRNTGPGIVGKFGEGVLPVIQMTGNTYTLGFSSKYTPTFSDWRIMDLEFDGMSGAKSVGMGTDGQSGGTAQVTILRMTFRNFQTSIGFGQDLLSYFNTVGTLGRHKHDLLAIVDCTVIAGTNTVYGGYNAGSRIAFMGNNFDNGGNPSGSHITRWPYLNKAVISNNTLTRPGFTRLAIKLHGPTWVNGETPRAWTPYEMGDGYSQQVAISDNKFVDAGNPYTIMVGPQNTWSDERVRDVILERNLHITTPTSQIAQHLSGSNITSRNNLFMGGGGNTQYAVGLAVYGHDPAGGNMWVYNNSMYSVHTAPSRQLAMVNIESTGLSNIVVKNNLMFAPNATNPLLYLDAGATNVVTSNNSSNEQVKMHSPLFASIPPVLVTDWTPKTNSYAHGRVGSNLSVPVFSDFFRHKRTSNGLGAIEK